MNNNFYDIAVIGLGVAGSFATLKLSSENKNLKIIGIDLGAGPAKRRWSMGAFLGLLPFSDGKFYESDLEFIKNITNNKKIINANNYVNNIINNVNCNYITDRGPNSSIKKKINKYNYNLQLNNYTQLLPKEIHSLSKIISENIEKNKNINLLFNSEVFSISKQKGFFNIKTENEEIFSKKMIFAVGRAGWRFSNEIFKKFDIIEENNLAKYGICIEMNSSLLKDFNNSSCSLIKNDLKKIEIGPFSWHGTIIPEDHTNMAISSFRSNEERWKTDKVFFNLIGNIECENKGFEETDRLANLTFILNNDRVAREKINLLMNGKSKISIIKEYNWIKQDISDLSNIIPDLLDKGYFHAPTIIPLAPKIMLGKKMESEIDGMFVCGESAGIPGLLGAAVSGVICADQIIK